MGVLVFVMAGNWRFTLGKKVRDVPFLDKILG